MFENQDDFYRIIEEKKKKTKQTASIFLLSLLQKDPPEKTIHGRICLKKGEEESRVDLFEGISSIWV